MAKRGFSVADYLFSDSLLGKTTDQLIEELVSKGYLEIKDEKEGLTDKGKNVGGESKKGRFGSYFLWNEDLSV